MTAKLVLYISIYFCAPLIPLEISISKRSSLSKLYVCVFSVQPNSSAIIQSLQSVAIASRRKQVNPYLSTTYTKELRWPSSGGTQPWCWAPLHPETLTQFVLDKHTKKGSISILYTYIALLIVNM